jgi:hypothetical protein
VSADHAAGKVGNGVWTIRSRPTWRAVGKQAAVEGIQHIQIGLFGKARIECEAEQAAILIRMNHAAQIGNLYRRAVRKVLVHPDRAGFLGNEHPAIMGKAHLGGLIASADRHAAAEIGAGPGLCRDIRCGQPADQHEPGATAVHRMRIGYSPSSSRMNSGRDSAALWISAL